MAVRVKNNSWLRFADLRIVDGITFWDIVDLPEIVAQPDDIQYPVKGGDRLDLLADQYYADVRLKWVIMAANGMELEPSDLHEGDVLTIPAPRYVLNELFSGLSGSNVSV